MGPRARKRRTGRLAAPLGPASLLLIVALLGFGAGLRVQAQAESPRAGLVIQDASGRVRSYCIALDGPEISGLELLQRSGQDLAWQGIALGTMVCRIGDTGCDYPAQACWCHCRSLGGDCSYWAYHKLEDGAWAYAIVGPSARKLRDGDVDGWAWGPGGLVSGAAPPLMTFAEICAAPPARGLGTATAPPRSAPPSTEGPAPGPGAAPSATAPAPADGVGRRPLPTLVPPSPSSPGLGAPGPAPSTTPREPSGAGVPGAEAGMAGSGPTPDVADPVAPLGEANQAPAAAQARADVRQEAASNGASPREAPGSDRPMGPTGSGERTGLAPGPGRGAPGSDPSSIRAVLAGLDFRSIIGYTLFALVFLGLAGLALSGRD